MNEKTVNDYYMNFEMMMEDAQEKLSYDDFNELLGLISVELDEVSDLHNG